MKTKTKLPEKLSSILSIAIRQAVEDLKKCEVDDRYVIEMSDWHVHAVTGKCEVCFAGAVMAKRLGVEPGTCVQPWSTNHENTLIRLNGISMGVVREIEPGGVPRAKGKTIQWLRDFGYEDDPAEFKRCLLRIAEMLERRGL